MRVSLLGEAYDFSAEDGKAAFLADFCSRLQFTYRQDFAAISAEDGRQTTSDRGWGCMMRTMQMMIGHGMLVLELGRDWRFEEMRDLQPSSTYLRIISCFLDKPEAPLSLHRFVASGQQLLGKPPATWFGPTSAAQVAGELLRQAAASNRSDSKQAAVDPPASFGRLACAVFEDGAIYRSEVEAHFERADVDAVLLLVRRTTLTTRAGPGRSG
eukprot:TRINITY_DN59312_c0_g1_i1.p1 TRINITY_DN59312_c0_g1~~TRINITY_DN59312_c0_g1_i1.p1  ORF type:complete len:213 (+),score=35.31 TRINITY_DN59312_c0_g1_i1:137-775(+)